MKTVQSNRKLFFPPASNCFIRQTIEVKQDIPNSRKYAIKIVDVGFDYEEITNAEGIAEKREIILGNFVRMEEISYDQIDNVYAAIGKSIKIVDNKYCDNSNDLFAMGLLFLTQGGCERNIAGAEDGNRGIYNSLKEDWELV